MQGTEGNSGSEATRRAFLAATGAVTLGGLAGCNALDDLVDSASEAAIENRTASPAGFYAGDASGDATAYTSGPVDVRFVPPSLRAEGRRIDIDGWSATTTTKAQDYNSSRSNRPRTTWVPDPYDDDADDDGLGTLVGVLDVERALLVYADAAIAAIERQSSDDATAALDAFDEGVTRVQDALEGCATEVCVSVREHAGARKRLAEDASDALAAGEWDGAMRHLREARRIVQGDIEDIRDDVDSDGDGISDGTEELYDYLGGEPTIGEHFVVTLPDARVRGDGPELAAELTPQRVLAYFLGERDADGCAQSDRVAVVHRDLACRNLLTARLAEPEKKIRHVAAFELSGGVVVTGATPNAGVSAPLVSVGPDNTVRGDLDGDGWGDEATLGEATASSLFVCPVVSTPADCPCPLPAILFVRRLRHDDQLIFAGGWLLDDGALYENSATVLTANGPNIVTGVTRSDIDEGGVRIEYQDGTDRPVRKKPGRTTYGNITLSDGSDPDGEYLPAGALPQCRDDGSIYLEDTQSEVALARFDTGDCDDTDDSTGPPTVLASALDAPILHLVGAAEASNDVKFKAGAELSKAVN